MPVKIFEKGISVEKPVNDFGELQPLLRDGDQISPKIDPSEPVRMVAGNPAVVRKSIYDIKCATGITDSPYPR